MLISKNRNILFSFLALAIFTVLFAFSFSGASGQANVGDCYEEISTSGGGSNYVFVCSNFEYSAQSDAEGRDIAATNNAPSLSGLLFRNPNLTVGSLGAVYNEGTVGGDNETITIGDPCEPGSGIYEFRLAGQPAAIITRTVSISNSNVATYLEAECEEQEDSSSGRGTVTVNITIDLDEPAPQLINFDRFGIELTNRGVVIDSTVSDPLVIAEGSTTVTGTAVLPSSNYTSGDLAHDNYTVCLIEAETSESVGSTCETFTLDSNVEIVSINISDLDLALALGGVSLDSTAGDDLSVDCEGVSFTNLGWILCPVIEGLERATSFMYRVVRTELALFTDSGVGGEHADRSIDISTDSDAYDVWKGFRNLARGLMVIALMVIIYAQLIGTSIVDAYNVRRMLPKFAIAVIGVELSWFVFSEFAILVEDVARGIPDLVLSATGLDIDNSIPITVDNAWLGGLGLAGVGIYAGLVYASSGGILFSLIPIALSVALALLVAFIVLVLRRLILVTLLILAPIALVLWVIPGTEKLFGKWFNLYQNLLFMYPLIQLLIVSGIVISQIAGTVQITGSMTFEQIILALTAIVAYFAPYFMIPLTFKWAGGAVANIAGMVNDRSKGIIDRSKGWAQGQREGRTARGRAEAREREAALRDQGRRVGLGNRLKSGRLIGPLVPKGYTAQKRREENLEALNTQTQRQQLMDDEYLKIAQAKQGVEQIKYEYDKKKATNPKYLEHQERLVKNQEEKEAVEIAETQMKEVIAGMSFPAALDTIYQKLSATNSTDEERVAMIKLLSQRGDPGVKKIRDFDARVRGETLEVEQSDGSVRIDGPITAVDSTKKRALYNTTFGDLDPSAPDLTRELPDLLDHLKEDPAKVAAYGNSTFHSLGQQYIKDVKTASDFGDRILQTINAQPENLSVGKAEQMITSFGQSLDKISYSNDPNVRAQQERDIGTLVMKMEESFAALSEGRSLPIKVEGISPPRHTDQNNNNSRGNSPPDAQN